MFSKIGDMLKVNPPAQDGGRKDGFARGQPQEGGGDRKGGAQDGENADSVLLSLDALRAMAKTQDLSPDGAKRFEEALLRIASHGLSRIPLRPGQSASDAVLETLSFLSSSRS